VVLDFGELHFPAAKIISCLSKDKKLACLKTRSENYFIACVDGLATWSQDSVGHGQLRHHYATVRYARITPNRSALKRALTLAKADRVAVAHFDFRLRGHASQ
jgi:hypothetical protein